MIAFANPVHPGRLGNSVRSLEKLQSNAANQAESTPQAVNLRDAKLHIAEKFRNRKPVGARLDVPTFPGLMSVSFNL